MKKGDAVKIRAFGNKILSRRVVAVYDDVVAVCRDEEILQAEKETREPNAVGFKVTDVLEVLPQRRIKPKGTR